MKLKFFNEDLKIATLMEGANLDIEVQIDLGRGYVPAEVNGKIYRSNRNNSN